VKVLFVVNGEDTSLPEVALLPVQAPEAVQVLAFVEDQVSVEDPPLATEVGFAASDTVGTAGATVTDADALAVVPPDPLQVRMKVLEAERAPVDLLPAVAFAPDHAPMAAQKAALLEDQVRFDAPPLVTDVGFAASDTVGGFVAAAGAGAGGDLRLH